ncbi:MAG TPA: PDZ domain-containing protein [Candidatus Baltobacteraceae bacterium]|jgi:S1-C subfamily serine protease|nr:PDZ domain-containing protein [Candidatus Baltobacteraceae bacterium]
MQRHFAIIFGVVLVTLTGALAKKESGVPAPMTTQKQLALVRVNVTGQSYDYFRPWQKKAPFSKRALGAVLSKGRVLVTADLVANQNFVELERAETGEKTAAKVQVIDYEANLALLEPTEKTFLDGITPLEITADTVVGDRLAAWQLEPTGALLATEGLVTTVQVTEYPIDVGQFLTYRVSIPMQYRENSYTVPLVKNNKLAGLLLRYDSRSQLLDAIPAPIITHFLKEADSQNYRGFPSAGFSFFPTRDPELREFAGEKGKGGGVYVTNVEPNTPAMKAGLHVGDIVTAVADREIDQNGNYVDSLHGKIEFTNLLTAHAYAGDAVPFRVQRNGKPVQLNVTLEHRDAKDYVSPPYNFDEPPRYYVLGGLIFQELSRQYLKEWGPTWERSAPQRLVYFDRFQSELFPEGNRRVVILSQVLPADSTIGYDELAYLTVTKVNGKEIKSLGDLAEAVKQPIDGFIKIETEEDPKQIELDAAQVAAEAPNLQENYGISSMQHLD